LYHDPNDPSNTGYFRPGEEPENMKAGAGKTPKEPNYRTTPEFQIKQIVDKVNKELAPIFRGEGTVTIGGESQKLNMFHPEVQQQYMKNMRQKRKAELVSANPLFQEERKQYLQYKQKWANNPELLKQLEGRRLEREKMWGATYEENFPTEGFY
jgi:hypothetical protein